MLLVLAAVGVLCACGDNAPAPKPPAPIVPQASSARAPQAPVTPAATAGNSQSAPHAAAATQVTSTATSDPKVIEIAGLKMPKPVSWTWEFPSMQFRSLQYAIPAPGGATGAAELVFSVFAAGDGGPIDANVQRWVGQFRGPDGSPGTPKIEDRVVGGIQVKFIELAGSYQGMGQAAPRPGVMQLSAIIQQPTSTVFVRLVGPAATVESARQDFMAMIDALQATQK